MTSASRGVKCCNLKRALPGTASIAERRYLEVDPSQRLVASTLERRWNDALLQLEDLKNPIMREI